MKPAEFADVAALLPRLGGLYVEGRGRTAISRYYYAAFLELRDALNQRGLKFQPNMAHKYVREAFEHSADKNLKVIGRLLNDLKDLREEADYQIATPIQGNDLGEAARLYSDIIESVSGADLAKCNDPLGRRSPGGPVTP